MLCGEIRLVEAPTIHHPGKSLVCGYAQEIELSDGVIYKEKRFIMPFPAWADGQ